MYYFKFNLTESCAKDYCGNISKVPADLKIIYHDLESGNGIACSNDISVTKDVEIKTDKESQKLISDTINALTVDQNYSSRRIFLTRDLLPHDLEFAENILEGKDGK